MDSRVMYSSANSFKNHARFMPDILNINTRIMHYKLRSSQNLGKNSDQVTMAKSCLVEPYDNIDKILVRSLWPNLAFKTTNELDKILVQFSCLSLSICRLA